ncbi:YopX family protein [Oceanobacillus locisalsi]|uniref:YopX family protein n=1 Tax=Oceanobacillus locisalsi TaxID=546107 RepID=A0ABW3NJD6_9BACI
MREIKFRAWLKQHDIMIAVDSIDFAEEEIMIIDDTGIDRYFPFEEIELLQYTGIKDKNGEEIYEQDYVKDHKGHAYTVRYNDFCASMLYPLDGGEFMAIYPGIELEVIGNIYENPELLEES